MEEGMSEQSPDAGKMAGQPPGPPLSAIIGASRRVLDEKRACRHEPIEPVAAFVHVCKHCGLPIQSVPCVACDGMGLSGTSDRRCPVCRGAGIDRWEVET